MKFQYKQYNGATGYPIVRPVIPIEVSNCGISQKYEALIDSGADFCIFHWEIGELIGLDVPSGKMDRVRGLNDDSGEEYYIHPITIVVGGWKYNIDAGFKQLSGLSYGVLGQKGFFDLFKIKFDYAKGDIELSSGRPR